MNIWIIAHDSQPPSLGRYTRYYHFSKELNKRGYNTRVFAASTIHGTNVNTIKKSDKKKFFDLEEDGVNYTFIKTRSYINSNIKRVLNMFDFLINGKKVIKQNKYIKPDVIIGTSPDPLSWVLAKILAKKYNAKFIAESRDLWPEAIFNVSRISSKDIIGKLLLSLEKYIFNKADALIFLKEGDIEYLKEKKYLKSLGGKVKEENCYYINNGVNLKDFKDNIENNKIDDKDLDSDKFKVIYTGSIRKVNSIGFILDVAKSLKTYKDIVFLIYGSGNQVNELNERISKEGITNLVIKESTDKKNIPYILNKSTVNILQYSPNLYNWTRGNSSNKLFEYFASGRPVISTVKIGYNPIIKYNCGITLEEYTVPCFKKAILDIYNLSQEEYNILCENSIEASKEFDYVNLTNKMEEILKKLELEL